MSFLQDTFSGVGAIICNVLGILFLIVGLMSCAVSHGDLLSWIVVIVAIVLLAMGRAFSRR
jgi:hypothetical protein